jgi:LysM repeat protein
MRAICLISLIILYAAIKFAYSQPLSRISRPDYFNTYYELAVEEMKRTGIPASITLAQAVLESDDGNSYVAKRANNHFGIKCRVSWKGDTINYDDDAKKECFRKYGSVLDSYKDHSDFLSSGKRYSFLFKIDKTDYKSWAEGLKKAGYATNPKYSILIIKVIEDNKLYLYDNPKYVKALHKKDLAENNTGKDKVSKQKTKNEIRIDEFTFNPFIREIFIKNRVKYIFVRKGDTFYKLSKELNLTISQLVKYNDISADSSIIAGQVLYIEPKRFYAEKAYQYHFVDPGESMYSISQFYAVRLKSLCRKNHLGPDSVLKPGDKLWLRSKKK